MNAMLFRSAPETQSNIFPYIITRYLLQIIPPNLAQKMLDIKNLKRIFVGNRIWQA